MSTIDALRLRHRPINHYKINNLNPIKRRLGWCDSTIKAISKLISYAHSNALIRPPITQRAETIFFNDLRRLSHLSISAMPSLSAVTNTFIACLTVQFVLQNARACYDSYPKGMYEAYRNNDKMHMTRAVLERSIE